MKRIIFTVTNDLTYDQRMQRICSSLAANGFEILLIGRRLKDSKPLEQKLFKQRRLKCLFNKGFLFYTEYNVRLFLFLLITQTDAVCAIDLDTILPCYFVSLLKRTKRIYDAHELFTEQKEIITRNFIHKIWLKIERFSIPRFSYGYTVSESIAEEFYKRYKAGYKVIRNLPLRSDKIIVRNKERFILYQGAVNEARGLENLVISMKHIDVPLYIYGDGNIFERIKRLISTEGLEQKVFLKGKITPEELKQVTLNAFIGLNLVEPQGLNQLYSLANKFFDYIQAGLPQVTMNFTEYQRINKKYEVAVLVDTVDVNDLALNINRLITDEILYERLHANCLSAKEELNWQNEEKKLIKFYKMMFN